MYPRLHLPDRLLTVIATQHGVFTRQQACAAGIPDGVLQRKARQGALRRVAHGLYSTRTSTSWEALVIGGLLLAGEGAAIGGLAAGYLLKLWPEQPRIIDIWGDQTPGTRGPWRYRRGPREHFGDPPRIKAVDCVLDVASAMQGLALEEKVHAALRTGRVNAGRIAEALRDRPNLRNRSLIIETLAFANAGAESVLESHYLRHVEAAHSLPTGERQYKVGTNRVDVHYRGQNTVVELDGRLGHEGEGAFTDAGRDNTNSLVGLASLRYGWPSVRGSRACRTAVEVGALLVRNGWAGPERPATCPRCG